jgi:predicted MFS family arabinose efflux permease
MTALVYGFIRAAQEGWGDPLTIGSFATAVVLLAVFLLIETRTPQPITPLHMFRNRNRAGSYLVMLCLAAALFGMFFFLTLFVQNVLGYSPLRAGIAFLPVSAAIIVSAQLTSARLSRVGPKPFMTAGTVLSVLGLTWLTRLTVGSGYVDGLLGPMLLFGVGMGLVFVPLTMVAVSGVDRQESGAASSLLNVMQQVGGSLGLSILVTAFGTASSNAARDQIADFLANATPQLRALFQQTGQLPALWAQRILAHGISTSFLLATLFAVIAFAITVVAIRTPRA